MSAAEFVPFAITAPTWRSTDALLTGHGRDADTAPAAAAGPQATEIPSFVLAAAQSADVTDVTDAPPADWRDGVAHMLSLPRPEWASIARWGRLRSAILIVRDIWAEQAFAAGWSTVEVFGCNHNPSVWRLDRNGLLMTLAGHLAEVAIRSVRPGLAEFEDARGSILRMRLPIGPGSVPIWVAYAKACGP